MTLRCSIFIKCMRSNRRRYWNQLNQKT